MKTLASVRSEIEARLKEVFIEEARLDAQLLLCHALNIEPIEYALETKRHVTDQEYSNIIKLMNQRLSRIPMSQIFGDKEFWSLNFKVTKDTLTPRPDSETLIEACLKEIKDPNAPLRILDMGTGTGCLLLALLSEIPHATGLGIDISEKALKVAKENADALSLSNRAEFRLSNWVEKILAREKFDIIISNPPYIGLNEKEDLAPEVREHEPHGALFAGDDGLDDYKRIANGIYPHLGEDAIIILEIGHMQAAPVKEIFTSSGFNNISVYQDLGRRDRCLVVRP